MEFSIETLSMYRRRFFLLPVLSVSADDLDVLRLFSAASSMYADVSDVTLKLTGIANCRESNESGYRAFDQYDS